MNKTRCIKCDKPLVHRTSLMVLMRTDGQLFTERNIPRGLPAEQDQGWFEVGSDCYKRIDKAGPMGLAMR